METRMGEGPTADEADEEALGATYVLTPTGWELTDYAEPGEDWRAREDGSFESPDGTTRTWPPASPLGQ